eukprot:TRINITY_DN51624_c0_g2_i1.p1 TRINITY_DN51624_c0_g2~~TRINITY_DN51624_c0_g2_i1.p1  ORF type:complete len:893 (-),score=187.50 TRINITY_DN51624_c0_g2_i1:79-2757(-)
MSSAARLKYKIVRVASEDPEYPASELLQHSSQTVGWQSARFCDYPQELILQFETPVHLRQVQFLSHQSKIASKIELFTAQPQSGQAPRLESAEFKRLGYLSLDPNERSQFQARELKSVYVDVSAQYLRLLLHKCHVNKFNIVNQVGLVALNCLGDPLGPDLACGPPPPNPVLQRGPYGDQGHAVKPQQQTPSPVGQAQYGQLPPPQQHYVPAPAPAAPVAQMKSAQEIADEQNLDSRSLERVRALEDSKRRAVEAEDYEEAKRCKDMLARLRQTATLLKDLEDRKRAAVEQEDYDAAKALKIEIDRVRYSLENPQAAAPPVSNGGFSHQPSSRGTPVDPPFVAAHNTPPPWQQGHQQPAFGGPMGGAPQHYEPPPHQQHQQPQMPLDMSDSWNAEPPASGRMAHSNKLQPQEENMHMEPKHSARQTGSPLLPAQAASMGQPQGGGFGGHPADAADAHEDPEADEAFLANHPLKGVPNYEDLARPGPEALAATVAQDAEPLVRLFGEYITRCIYSKAWNLRDAALQKLAMDLRDGVFRNNSEGELLEGFVTILQRTILDKNVQVFLASAALCQTVCEELMGNRSSLRRQDVHSSLDPVMGLLAERIGDPKARADQLARDVHLQFARCPLIGPAFSCNHILKAPKKKSLHARVYISRLQLLTQLIVDFGVQPESREGLPMEPTVPLAMEWFNNPSAEVREGSVKLVGAVYSYVGKKVESYLASLRAVQRDVFDTEFERISNGGASGAGSAQHSARGEPKSARGQAPKANSGGAQRHDAPARIDEAEEDEEEHDFTCQFCGKKDASFTPDALDVHYWRECPMLTQCSLCEQVVEVSGLLVHFLEECEKTAEAQAKAQSIADNHCALCGGSVGAGEDQDWRQHLLQDGCPNARPRV